MLFPLSLSFLGMWDWLGFGDLGLWPVNFVSAHFLLQISIFQSSFWFVNTLLYRTGSRYSEYFIYYFSVLIRDIKIDLFFSFSAVPIIMGHISKIKPRFVQYAKIIIISKHNQVWDFMATCRLVRSGVLGGLMI